MKKLFVLTFVLFAFFSISANAEFENPVYENAFIGTIDILYDEEQAYFQASDDCEVFSPIGLNGSFSWSKLHITSWEHSIYGAYMGNMEYAGSIHILYDPFTDGDRAMWILDDAPEGKILNILYSYNGASSGVMDWSDLGLTKELAEELLEKRHRIANEGAGSSYTIEVDLNNRSLASATGKIRFDSAFADSTLSDGYGTYPVENMFDGDASTAWAEGFEGTDFGGQLEMEWGVVQGQWWCEGIAFRAGYQKSEQTYYNNSRPKQMQVLIENRAEYRIELLDYNGWQYVIFDEPILMEESFFDVVICMGDGTYKGDRYLDTCISEIDLIVTSNQTASVSRDPAEVILEAINDSYGGKVLEINEIGHDLLGYVTPEIYSYELIESSNENLYGWVEVYGEMAESFNGIIVDETIAYVVNIKEYYQEIARIYSAVIEGIYGVPCEELLFSLLEDLGSQVQKESGPAPSVEITIAEGIFIKMWRESGYVYMKVQ